MARQRDEPAQIDPVLVTINANAEDFHGDEVPQRRDLELGAQNNQCLCPVDNLKFNPAGGKKKVNEHLGVLAMTKACRREPARCRLLKHGFDLIAKSE